MVRDQVSRVDGERAAVHFLRKRVDIFEQCEPLHCQHEQRVFSRRPLTGIESVLPGHYHNSTRVQGAPLRKCHDQGKSQWVPCNGNDDFPVSDRMSRPFRWYFSRSKPDLLMIRRQVKPRLASPRETSRLIADPLNCTFRLNVIFHFFLTNFDFSLYTNKLKENFSGDNYWEYLLYGMQCSSKCSTAQVLGC
jgi:hypothetical protein